MEATISDSLLQDKEWLGHVFTRWQAELDLHFLKGRNELPSIRKLALRWQWQKAKVERFLKMQSETGARHLRDTFICDSQAFISKNETSPRHLRDTKEKEPSSPINNIIITPPIEKETNTKRSGSNFKPPTLEEVQAYIQEKGYTDVDPAQWWHFYNSKNWFVGKNKMKVWKSAVATWHNKQNKYGTADRSSGNTYSSSQAREDHLIGLLARSQQTDMAVNMANDGIVSDGSNGRPWPLPPKQS